MNVIKLENEVTMEEKTNNIYSFSSCVDCCPIHKKPHILKSVIFVLQVKRNCSSSRYGTRWEWEQHSHYRLRINKQYGCQFCPYCIVTLRLSFEFLKTQYRQFR
ncbi:hypothetical protein NPIL_8841 [Nephila pilipes]|uniref:Uncharacterized protein n=1 Tax=Nephila pilipes TaxID=299642 RepID=A0A8X6UUV8_NEPPI|nr:hypothetical protein NPIL_8841 [Nephila pilipes]